MITVKELIKELAGLENQDADIAIEAPIYNAGSETPYQWPATDFAIDVTGVENEFDSPGDSYMIKTCLEVNNPSLVKHDNKVIEAVDSLTAKLQLVKSQHLTVYIKTPAGEYLAVIGVEDEKTREDIDGLLLLTQRV